MCFHLRLGKCSFIDQFKFSNFTDQALKPDAALSICVELELGVGCGRGLRLAPSLEGLVEARQRGGAEAGAEH